MSTPPQNQRTADPAAALSYAHPGVRSSWRPTRTLGLFFAGTFITDASILAVDALCPRYGGEPLPNPFAVRLLAHGLFDVLALTILWFGMGSRGRSGAIIERPWFVAAAAGVLFAVLLYGPSLITFDKPRVTDPGNLEGGQTGASWPILVYFLYPLAAAVVITRRRRPTDEY